MADGDLMIVDPTHRLFCFPARSRQVPFTRAERLALRFPQSRRLIVEVGVKKMIPAPRWATRDVLHGCVVDDPYRWLETSDSAAARQWLAAQKSLFLQHRSGWRLLWDLRDRITQALDGAVWSPPKVRGARLFAAHRAGSADHPRLLVLEEGQARVLVDVLALDAAGTTTLDRWEPSPAGRLVAVQTSRCGTERSSLVVIDATSGEVVDGPIGGLRYSPIAWFDEGAFYYVRGPNVRFHRVGLPGRW